MLARSFGCTRVVYNDALRLRRESYLAGEKLSEDEVMRRVTTVAKTTEERQWLNTVPAVILQQSCRDAHRAYRNWFNSLSGKRKGRKVGAPRFRSRKNRQSIRFTRNGFTLRPNTKLHLARIGDIKVIWSRPLPSTPSSVTIIREADGQYYASFVVERTDCPLPTSTNDIGVDLGLTHLAVLSTGEKIDNPRHFRGRQRRLAISQRSLAKKSKGSNNRLKAVKRVAVHHRKVREARLDTHRKLALRLIRENQTIYLEDLSIIGMTRTKLAKSVSDVGWGILIGLIEEKAEQYGRQVIKVSRWFPSSRICSTCGHNSGPKPLSIRQWICEQCNTDHDRDINAAQNILIEGRRIAAGLAETINACGVDVRPSFGGC